MTGMTLATTIAKTQATAAQATAQSHATNLTAIFISVGIVFCVCAAIAVSIWSYFRLQGHRADAVAMAHYRKLAEDAVANQQELRAELAKLTVKVEAVEKLMRDVG